MRSEDIDEGRTRYSRRQALGRMGAVATAGAVAWVVPEILTAEPAAGASLSGVPNITSGGGGGGSGSGGGGSGGGGGSTGVSTSPSTGGATTAAAPTSGTGATGGPLPIPPTSGPLAATGANFLRDAEVGAALVASGWLVRRWTSRRPTPAVAETGEPDGTGSLGDSPR